jgi:2-polyprenyl-3-methyl-5-hydroxy-6-metoxy-1,4-benzoquinol methylase
VYAERAEILPPERLKERYRLHENGIDNEGYRAFLSRALDAARPYWRPGARGLDFGCGPGPTLSRLAEREGLVMTDYDPLFFDVPLQGPYDVVFSTECFEHFEDPSREIARVAALLREGGVLCVMTELWNEATDFGSWYYAADPTHVCFYSKETLDHVCRRFGLTLLAGDGKRVFVFSKAPAVLK